MRYLVVVLLLTACGDQKQVADSLNPDPKLNPTPTVDGWCPESAEWTPSEGGCKLKVSYNPDHPSWRLVLSEPKLITVLDSHSCEDLVQRDRTDWVFLQQGTDESAQAASFNHPLSVPFSEHSEWLDSQNTFWTYASEAQFDGCGLNGAGSVYNTNPSPMGPKNYLICMRIVDDI